MRQLLAAGAAIAATLAAPAAPAARSQDPAGEPLTNAGLARAAARVDSVFVSRTARQALIRGGDFASYLIGRLGVNPIPPDLTLRVTVQPSGMVLAGRLGDLPAQARDAMGTMFALLPLSTPIAGEIAVARVAPDAVRFRLAGARVNGIPIPETVLNAIMAAVVHQYAAPTPSTRDLVVRVPPEGNLQLLTGWVRLSRTVPGQGDRP
jgi:hypothetical protein